MSLFSVVFSVWKNFLYNFSNFAFKEGSRGKWLNSFDLNPSMIINKVNTKWHGHGEKGEGVRSVYSTS